MMKRGKKNWDSNPYCPTQADIRKACEEIQARWSENESLRRAGISPKQVWTPPMIVLDNHAVIEDEAA